MTGPAVPPGGEELREAVARWAADPGEPISEEDWPLLAAGYRAFLLTRADELLALRPVRDALAAQETLRRYANDPAPTSEQLRDLVIRNRELEATVARVEKLAGEWQNPHHSLDLHWCGRNLRRALAGDS